MLILYLQPEQEAEKALGYIEGLSGVQVTATLLCSGTVTYDVSDIHVIVTRVLLAMTSMHMMLWHDFNSKWSDSDIKDMGESFNADLTKLGEMVLIYSD
jgi:hypothetical protein